MTEVIGAGRDGADLDLVDQGVALLRDLRLPPDPRLQLPAAAQLGWADLFAGRPERAAGPMYALIDAARAGPVDPLHRIVAGLSGVMLADDDATVAVMETMLGEARATGAMLWVPYSLEVLGLGRMLRGDLADAAACVTEGLALADELGMPVEAVMLRGMGLWHAAATGDEEAFRALDAALPPDGPDTHRVGTAVAAWGRGLRHLGAGRAADAFAVLAEVCAGPARRDLLVRALPDLVEAAVRCGRATEARTALVELDRWARATGAPRAAALAARARAQVAADDDAEREYLAALRAHEQRSGPFDEARTRLRYGAWLRRRRRRTEAREQLTEASASFRRLGAEPWVAQAGAELTALGARPGPAEAGPDLAQRLTPQELQVVRLAAGGLSNKEIGARLFLSPRTVGHHLYRAYPKLGVARRMELASLRL